MKNPRAKRFKDALIEWDAFKEKVARELADGRITQEEYKAALEVKANELDL